MVEEETIIGAICLWLSIAIPIWVLSLAGWGPAIVAVTIMLFVTVVVVSIILFYTGYKMVR